MLKHSLEQKIGRGSVNLKESVTSGLTNALSGAIYGNAPLKSAKSAFLRGAGAGATTAAINNLSKAWDTQNVGYESGAGAGLFGGTAGGWANPYGIKRDPKTICGAASPFGNNIGYSTAYGYQYGQSYGGAGISSTQKKQSGFSLGDFAKDVLIGAVTGGVASATFYGAGKAVDALKGSIRGNKGGSKGTGSIKTPYGNAAQSTSKEALQVRNYVDDGGQLYRTGEFGKSKVTDAQFWSPENPLSSGYANKYGLANSQVDYVIGGTKVSSASYVTRPAPPVPPNLGGGIEVVTNPNSVKLNFFHMP